MQELIVIWEEGWKTQTIRNMQSTQSWWRNSRLEEFEWADRGLAAEVLQDGHSKSLNNRELQESPEGVCEATEKATRTQLRALVG